MRDLDASLLFYAKLGIAEAFRLYRDDGSAWIVYLQINPNRFVELFPTPNLAASPSAKDIPYHHNCFQVDDIETTVREIEARGVVIDRPIKLGLGRNYQAWIVDPDGNRIELMQIMPDSRQAAAGQTWASS